MKYDGYNGENIMLLTGPEFTGGIEDDEDQLPKSWDDTWDRDELANAVYNTGDEWLKGLKPEDRERVYDRLADFLGFALMDYDFAWNADAAEKYKSGCVTVVRGMLKPGYYAEDMIWKWLARMFRDDEFDSSDEESSFFEWFKKRFEDDSWSWVRRTQHIEHDLKI